MPVQRDKSTQQPPRTRGGQKLKALRQASGLSLVDLAARLEADLERSIDAGHIHKVETGKIKQPETHTLETILAGLNASYRDRRDVLEAFGYSAPMTLPTEQEVAEAIQLATDELYGVTYPVCLRDFGQRLWAWNRYAPRLIGLHPDDPATARFFGVTTLDLTFNPTFETRLVVANPDEFLPDMLQTIKVGIYPLRELPGYRELLDQWRTFPRFSELWESVPADRRRPVVPLEVKVPDCGLLHFRLSYAEFYPDPRFCLLHFTPFGATTLRVCADWAEEEGVV